MKTIKGKIVLFLMFVVFLFTVPTESVYAIDEYTDNNDDENDYDSLDEDADSDEEDVIDDSEDLTEADEEEQDSKEDFYNTCTVTLSKSVFRYTGKNIRPKVTVKNKDGIVLKEGKDYSIVFGDLDENDVVHKYKSTKNVGYYYIYIEGKAPYTFFESAGYDILFPKNAKCKITNKNGVIKVYPFMNKDYEVICRISDRKDFWSYFVVGNGYGSKAVILKNLPKGTWYMQYRNYIPGEFFSDPYGSKWSKTYKFVVK